MKIVTENNMQTYLIDTHAHIDMLEDGDLAVKTANEYGVKKIIVPCADPKDLQKVYDVAQKYENVFALLGVHPSDIEGWNDDLLDFIKQLAQNPKVVGIGEIGLDYYYEKETANRQQEIFIKQIKLANELNLPIAIHDREAHKDTFDILKEYNKNSTVLLHCYSGSSEFADLGLKEGWYFALGGIVTFKNAVKVKEVARHIPLDRLMIETDSPYLAPTPHRGEKNQPAYVKFVAEEIAKLREISFEELAQKTSENAERVFGI